MARPAPELIVGVAGALLAAGIAVVIAYPESLRRPFLLIALAIVIPMPIIFRAVQGKLDLFEPIVFFAVGHLSLYVARPLAQLAYHQDGLAGYPIMASFDTAATISLVGVCAVYAGYTLPVSRRIAARLRPPPRSWPQSLTLMVAGISLAIGLMLWGVFLVQSGGFGTFFTYIQGRSTADPTLFRGSSAYFYLAPFVGIPAALMLLDSNARRRSALALIGGVCSVLFILVITGPRGDRTFLLLLALPLLAQHYLRKGRRPPVLPALVAVLVAILLVNVLIAYRRVDARQDSFTGTLTKSVTDPSGQLKEFVLGPDTTMFPLTSIMVETLDHHRPLSTVTSFLASPVPGQLWVTKPRDPDTVFYQRVFPQAAAATDAGNALGYLGSYWYDAGYPSLILYGLLTGLGFRVVFEYFRRYPAYAGAQLLYAMVLPFTIVLIRGNPTQSFGPGLFILGPVIALVFFAGRSRAA